LDFKASAFFYLHFIVVAYTFTASRRNTSAASNNRSDRPTFSFTVIYLCFLLF